MNLKVRTSNDKSFGVVQLCKHITIAAKETKDKFPQCEYEELLQIYCKQCKTTHEVIIAVN